VREELSLLSVVYVGFDCRCGGQFCSLHRYANEHHCTFDYKEHGQNEIRKNMPVVQAERVRRI
jgi:predicted nucleic acid binding AN1-type Zn finger protein